MKAVDIGLTRPTTGGPCVTDARSEEDVRSGDDRGERPLEAEGARFSPLIWGAEGCSAGVVRGIE